MHSRLKTLEENTPAPTVAARILHEQAAVHPGRAKFLKSICHLLPYTLDLLTAVYRNNLHRYWVATTLLNAIIDFFADGAGASINLIMT
jgi:hypothetical protein